MTQIIEIKSKNILNYFSRNNIYEVLINTALLQISPLNLSPNVKRSNISINYFHKILSVQTTDYTIITKRKLESMYSQVI